MILMPHNTAVPWIAMTTMQPAGPGYVVVPTTMVMDMALGPPGIALRTVTTMILSVGKENVVTALIKMEMDMAKVASVWDQTVTITIPMYTSP